MKKSWKITFCITILSFLLFNIVLLPLGSGDKSNSFGIVGYRDLQRSELVNASIKYVELVINSNETVQEGTSRFFLNSSQVSKFLLFNAAANISYRLELTHNETSNYDLILWEGENKVNQSNNVATNESLIIPNLFLDEREYLIEITFVSGMSDFFYIEITRERELIIQDDISGIGKQGYLSEFDEVFFYFNYPYGGGDLRQNQVIYLLYSTSDEREFGLEMYSINGNLLLYDDNEGNKSIGFSVLEETERYIRVFSVKGAGNFYLNINYPQSIEFGEIRPGIPSGTNAYLLQLSSSFGVEIAPNKGVQNIEVYLTQGDPDSMANLYIFNDKLELIAVNKSMNPTKTIVFNLDNRETYIILINSTTDTYAVWAIWVISGEIPPDLTRLYWVVFAVLIYLYRRRKKSKSIQKNRLKDN